MRRYPEIFIKVDAAAANSLKLVQDTINRVYNEVDDR